MICTDLWLSPNNKHTYFPYSKYVVLCSCVTGLEMKTCSMNSLSLKMYTKMKRITLAFIYFSAHISSSLCVEYSGNISQSVFNFSFIPEEIKALHMDTYTTIQVDLKIMLPMSDINDSLVVRFHTESTIITKLTDGDQYPLLPNCNSVVEDNNEYTACSFNVTLFGDYLGRTLLHASILDIHSNAVIFRREEDYKITVIFPLRTVDFIFTYILQILIAINNVAFGCKFDFSAAKEVFKKPIAPAIGMFCQSVVLPLVSIRICRTHL